MPIWHHTHPVSSLAGQLCVEVAWAAYLRLGHWRLLGRHPLLREAHLRLLRLLRHHALLRRHALLHHALLRHHPLLRRRCLLRCRGREQPHD